MLEIIATVVSVGFLLLIFGLATMAFRGGEHAGQHQTATPMPATTGPAPIRRRTSVGAFNQFVVYGLTLSLMAMTVAMLVASFVWDSWTWH